MSVGEAGWRLGRDCRTYPALAGCCLPGRHGPAVPMSMLGPPMTIGWGRLGLKRREYVAIEDGERPPKLERVRGDLRVLRVAGREASGPGSLKAILPRFCPTRVLRTPPVERSCRSGSSGGGTRTHNLRISSTLQSIQGRPPPQTARLGDDVPFSSKRGPGSYVGSAVRLAVGADRSTARRRSRTPTRPNSGR